MIGNYEKILEKIAKNSGLSIDEVERRIEAKRAKLSGLISREGAAQVIAAELGISFDNEKLKINELLPGMRKVNVVGKVIRIFPVRTFSRNGKDNKVANMIIADDTANIKVVLWDANHISQIETGKIADGTVVGISNGSMRESEIHLGSFSDIKPVNEEIGNIVLEKMSAEKDIANVQNSDRVKLRAFIIQTFEPRFFEICPECKKRAIKDDDGFLCEQHGRVAPDRRALVNIVLDDGTETMRTVVFSDNFPKLGLSSWNEEDPERLALQRQDLLGKEMLFSGDVRTNKFFNNIELIVDQIEEINLDALIKSLEKK